jgi:hypothetical protein
LVFVSPKLQYSLLCHLIVKVIYSVILFSVPKRCSIKVTFLHNSLIRGYAIEDSCDLFNGQMERNVDIVITIEQVTFSYYLRRKYTACKNIQKKL